MSLALDTLHREGYDYINRRNFNSFMRFLDDARAKGLGALYSSTQLIDKIHEMKRRGLTKKQILTNISRWSRISSFPYRMLSPRSAFDSAFTENKSVRLTNDFMIDMAVAKE